MRRWPPWRINERAAGALEKERAAQKMASAWRDYPGRSTIPDLDESALAPFRSESPQERSLRDLYAPQDEAYSFYAALRRTSDGGGWDKRPLFFVVPELTGKRRWMVACRHLPGIGTAGFQIAANWGQQKIVAPLAATWLDPDQAVLSLETAAMAQEYGHSAMMRSLALPGWSLRLRFRPGSAPDERARREARQEVFGIVSLTALLLLGLFLFWRQATFEARLARMRQDLVDSLSHTLKTPLARVRLLAENLQQGWVNNEAKRAEFLQTIVNESDRLDAVIRRLLDVARIESGEKVFQLRPQPLAPLLHEAARRFSSRYGGDVSLRLDIDETLPMALADGEVLGEAVEELLTDARNIPGRRRSSYCVCAGSAAGRQSRSKTTALEIRWRERCRLFAEVFPLRRAPRGCHGRQRAGIIFGGAHGACPSRPGAGAQPLAGVAAAFPCSFRWRKKMATILLIEDDPVLIEGLREAFTFHDHRLFAAGNGVVGLRLLAECRPDLAIVDVMLPGPDGFEVCRQLRDRRPDLPVIFLTARGGESDKLLGFASGGDDYLTKPFSMAELLARVQAVLRRSEARSVECSIRAGTALIDFAGFTVRHGDAEYTLTPKERDILKLLLENPGRVFSRDEIARPGPGRRVCARCQDGATTSILKLRDDRGRPAAPPPYPSLHGAGYKFVP